MAEFFNGLQSFYASLENVNSTQIEKCSSNVNHYKFYQLCLIPSIVITLLMAATKSRRRMLLSFLYGRPSFIFPMDTFTRSSRISYCCAFGATTFLVYQILLDGKFALDLPNPGPLKTLIAVLSMFIYGMVFFPVFASLALETAVSYFVGSLYVWMFFVIEIYKNTECNFTFADRALLLTRALPSLLCLAYLSISMPIKFCIAIYHKRYVTPSLGEDPYNETLEQIKKSFQGKHVIKLFKKPEFVSPPNGVMNIIMSTVRNKAGEWIYHNHSGFHYPSRVLSVMFVSGSVVYMLTIELIAGPVSLCNKLLEMYEDSLAKLGPKEPEENDDTDVDRLTTEILYFIVVILKVSLIVALSVSSCISFLNILHMMSSFRTNLFALYKGDFSHIPPPNLKSAIALCTGSIKYAGFQVAYIVWAYLVVFVILLIVCLVLATVIEILRLGFTDWLVVRLNILWPGLVIAIGLFAIQFLLAKFVFLQNRGEHLRLDNRRFYFIFVFFMFFFNIFLGLFSCLLRIIKALVVGTLFLARLDNSTLPRKFEFFDPGFNAYQGYIHMEAAHTHPVVNVFLRLLVALSNFKKKQNYGDKQAEMSRFEVTIDIDNCKLESDTDYSIAKPVNAAARFKWHVSYTLLHNPAVRIYRKGFIQSMKKARKEGLKVPISDHPITDFDIVKAQEERDKQRAEEAKNPQSSRRGLSEGFAAITLSMGTVKNDEMKIKQNRKRPKKHKWFRKWKKRNGNIVCFDNISEERSLENENPESYTKTEIV